MNSFVKKKTIFDEKIKLARLDLELTHRCNNRCIHCSVNLEKNDAKAAHDEKSFEFYDRILTEAKIIGCKRITITGGEPLLHPDFIEIYKFASKLGFSINLFTNATLIDEEYVKLFLDYPPKMIEITVYGMSRNLYEKVTRAKQSWQAAFRGIDLLHKNSIPFRLKGIELPFNRNDNRKLKEWAENVLSLPNPVSFVHGLSLRSVVDSNPHPSKIECLRIDPEQFYRETTESPELMQSEFLRLMDSLKPGTSQIFKCGAGKSQAAIDPYGRLQPCLTLRKKDATIDISNSSLQNALTNFFPNLRELKSSNEKYLRTCANCIIRPICIQCPANAWTESGSLDEPVDFYCRLAHAQARFAGFLKAGEFAWNTELHDYFKDQFIKKMKNVNGE